MHNIFRIALLLIGIFSVSGIPLKGNDENAKPGNPLMSRRLLVFTLPPKLHAKEDHKRPGKDFPTEDFNDPVRENPEDAPHWVLRTAAIVGLGLLVSYGAFLGGCLLYGAYKRRQRGYAQLAVEEPRQAIAQASEAAKHGADKSKHTLKDFWHKSKEKLHIGGKH